MIKNYTSTVPVNGREWRQGGAEGEKMNRRQHGRTKRICQYCGKEFYSLMKFVNRDGAKFCSYACAYKGRKTRFNSKTIKCAECGKGFLRSPSLISDYKHHFCSTKCYSLFQRKRNRGKNNSNWKGGISVHNIKIKGEGGKYMAGRGRAFERKAMKELILNDYYPIRSAGSRGLWDVIGIKKDDIKLIQVKRNVRINSKEKKRLLDFECPNIVSKEIWTYFGMGKKKVCKL